MFINKSIDNKNNICGNNIAIFRKEKKISQRELADLLNVTDKSVSKWERAGSLPDVATLKRIADVYGVTVDYLVTPHSE